MKYFEINLRVCVMEIFVLDFSQSFSAIAKFLFFEGRLDTRLHKPATFISFENLYVSSYFKAEVV